MSSFYFPGRGRPLADVFRVPKTKSQRREARDEQKQEKIEKKSFHLFYLGTGRENRTPDCGFACPKCLHGWRESNPRYRFWRPTYYHCTTPAYSQAGGETGVIPLNYARVTLQLKTISILCGLCASGIFGSIFSAAISP